MLLLMICNSRILDGCLKLLFLTKMEIGIIRKITQKLNGLFLGRLVVLAENLQLADPVNQLLVLAVN